MANFPPSVVAAAKAAQAKWRVPASVSLAQWAIESGYGKHMPPGSNNPFGIKARAGEPAVSAKTREVLKGKSVVIAQKFRAFGSLGEAFEAHGKLLATAKVYAEALRLWSTPPYDLDAGVRSMARHYATAPDYATVILGVIHSANLQRYDS